MSNKLYQFEVVIDGRYDIRSRELQSNTTQQQSVVEILTNELLRELMKEYPQQPISVKFLKQLSKSNI